MSYRLVHGQDDRVKAWAYGKMGMEPPPQGVALGGEDADGNLVFAAIFQRYAAGDVDITLYNEAPAQALRSIIREVMAYPFGQLKCRRVTAQVPIQNTRSIKLVRGLGFRQEGFKRGTNTIVFGLLEGELSV